MPRRSLQGVVLPSQAKSGKARLWPRVVFPPNMVLTMDDDNRWVDSDEDTKEDRTYFVIRKMNRTRRTRRIGHARWGAAQSRVGTR